jgi:hypothetical protein
MCQGMPAPPPDVVTELPAGAEYKTMRERLAQHMQDPACAGCHKLMDPIGLGLENYDGIGVFRTVENGVVLDTSETVDDLGDFDGARQLGALLKDSPDRHPLLGPQPVPPRHRTPRARGASSPRSRTSTPRSPTPATA